MKSNNVSYIYGLMASDGYMVRRVGEKTGRVSYNAIIELAEPQIIFDISDVVCAKPRYRSRIIASKVRHFWSLNIPKFVYGGNAECFLKHRYGLFNLYLGLSDKDSFIRGIFDGDGTVAETTDYRRKLRIGFSVNSECNDIMLILEHYASINGITLSKYFDTRGNGSWFISINRIDDVNKMFNLMYKNEPMLFLKRKYNRFISHGFPDLVTSRKTIW